MNKGQRLDTLLSTPDSGFNQVMQHMIWEHTPKGTIAPDDGIIEYMEVLYNVFFFCSDNYKTPYTCINHILETAKTDEYLLDLIQSILYLIMQSDKGEEMSILYGQLIDFRHELSPWDEDEAVKGIIQEMEKDELEINSLLASSIQANNSESSELTKKEIRPFPELLAGKYSKSDLEKLLIHLLMRDSEGGNTWPQDKKAGLWGVIDALVYKGYLLKTSRTEYMSSLSGYLGLGKTRVKDGYAAIQSEIKEKALSFLNQPIKKRK